MESILSKASAFGQLPCGPMRVRKVRSLDQRMQEPAREPLVLSRGSKDHIRRRILHSGSTAQDKGGSEAIVCRILMFTCDLLCPHGIPNRVGFVARNLHKIFEGNPKRRGLNTIPSQRCRDVPSAKVAVGL